jgi:uncharacterized membrane protein
MMYRVLIVTLVSMLVALGVHLWLARWLLSLTAPVLGFVGYLSVATYVLEDNPAKAQIGAALAAIVGLPYVILGGVAGALVARSLRAEYVDAHADNPFQPMAREDARSG